MRVKSKVNGFWEIIIPIIFSLLPFASNAQCAMCRASLESEGNIQKS